MKLLIVYHAGAMQNSRAIFRVLAGAGGQELTVVVPQTLNVDRVYHPSGRLSVEREENGQGYRLVPVPLRDPANYWQGFESESLRRVIKQTQADIIHVFDEPVSGYLFQVAWQRLAASRRSQVLFYGFENLPIYFGPRGWLKWRTTWACIAGGAAANTETLVNVRRAGFPAHRPLERIFWGVPTEIFQPLNKSTIKKELGFDHEYLVGFVGRLVEHKGLMVLLAAMRRFPARVHCLIVGNGPMRAELELWSGLPDLRGRIHLRDVVEPETLVQYMNCMDVITLPSLTTAHWKEQYGRVIAEAMACGVPVVGSDSGAIPEVIGSSGLVVPEGDPVALGDALHRLLSSAEAREGLRAEGLKRVVEELSVQAMSERLWQLYGRVLGG
jgi:glycosyltransferase involved in cell wall biosynthesis